MRKENERKENKGTTATKISYKKEREQADEGNERRERGREKKIANREQDKSK